MDCRHIVILTISLIYYVSCLPCEIEKSTKKNRPVCGDALKKALSNACDGEYAPGKTKKLDNDLFNFDDYEELEENYYDDKIYEFPFLRKDDMFAMLPSKRQQRTYRIVEECCHKPCTDEHMQPYCA